MDGARLDEAGGPRRRRSAGDGYAGATGRYISELDKRRRRWIQLGLYGYARLVRGIRRWRRARLTKARPDANRISGGHLARKANGAGALAAASATSGGS